MQQNNAKEFDFDFGNSAHNDQAAGNHYPMPEYIECMKAIEAANVSVDNNLKVMLTKFRKIYYNSFGWNDLLIPETKDIAPFPTSNALQKIKHSHEVVLSNHDLYDVAHIFAILDANNHNGPLTPVPESIIKSKYWPLLKDIVPVVNNRLMASGWLGDLSEVTGEIFLQSQSASKATVDAKLKQRIINTYAAYYKNLANVDGMIIANQMTNNKNQNTTLSNIFEHFYGNDSEMGEREKSTSLYLEFAQSIGLNGWSGSTFQNSDTWLKEQQTNLRTCTAFFIVKSKGLSAGVEEIRQDTLKKDLTCFAQNLKEEDARQPFCRYVLDQLAEEGASLDKDLETLVVCFLIWCGHYDSLMSLEAILSAYLQDLSSAIVTS